MSKRNRRKKQAQIITCESNGISESRMIEIQAEAYYRALKKVEDEKLSHEEQAGEKGNEEEITNLVSVLFVLNVVFFPWKIHKKFSVNNQIYDSVLVLLVSGTLKIVGILMWLTGIAAIVKEVYDIAKNTIHNTAITLFIAFITFLTMILLGSILILAGTEFSKEDDSNKIYAYSASIMALISCVVGIIALLKAQ